MIEWCSMIRMFYDRFYDMFYDICDRCYDLLSQPYDGQGHKIRVI